MRYNPLLDLLREIGYKLLRRTKMSDTIAVEWVIPTVYTSQEPIDGVADVVVAVPWRVRLTQGPRVSTESGLLFVEFDPQNYTPFEQLSAEIISGWVKEKVSEKELIARARWKFSSTTKDIPIPETVPVYIEASKSELATEMPEATASQAIDDVEGSVVPGAPVEVINEQAPAPQEEAPVVSEAPAAEPVPVILPEPVVDAPIEPAVDPVLPTQVAEVVVNEVVETPAVVDTAPAEVPAPSPEAEPVAVEPAPVADTPVVEEAATAPIAEVPVAEIVIEPTPEAIPEPVAEAEAAPVVVADPIPEAAVVEGQGEVPVIEEVVSAPVVVEAVETPAEAVSGAEVLVEPAPEVASSPEALSPAAELQPSEVIAEPAPEIDPGLASEPAPGAVVDVQEVVVTEPATPEVVAEPAPVEPEAIPEPAPAADVGPEPVPVPAEVAQASPSPALVAEPAPIVSEPAKLEEPVVVPPEEEKPA